MHLTGGISLLRVWGTSCMGPSMRPVATTPHRCSGSTSLGSGRASWPRPEVTWAPVHTVLSPSARPGEANATCRVGVPQKIYRFSFFFVLG